MRTPRRLILTDAGGGGGGFDPLTLSPAAWWDFSDASSVTLNSGNVSQINDKSGNTQHITQGTASRQPLYSLAAQNGRNVAVFDGTNDTLSRNPFGLAQPFTVFSVIKVTGLASEGNIKLVWGSGSFPSQYVRTTSGTGRWSSYGGANLNATSPVTDSNFHVLVSTFDGASSSIRLDGSDIVTGSLGAIALSGNFYVGSDGASGFWNGAIASILLCPTPSAAARNAYEASLKAIWGTP